MTRAGERFGGRDPRVDFFRGLCFLIIFIAHVPGNWLGRWIPAKFGWSDATEMFVFMSGYAAAIAFGGVFARRGFLLGVGRVAYRTWQVYTAHLTLFFFVVAFSAAAAIGFAEGGEIDRWTREDYIGKLNLWYFFDNTATAIIGIFTLRYVPNYFDILPMYLVILAMMPVVVAASRVHAWGGPALCVLIYMYMWTFGLELPAEVREGSDRPWFFNPFGWQLVFFTGFAIAMGWISIPIRSRLLFWISIAIIVFSALVSNRIFYGESEFLTLLREWVAPLRAKTDFAIGRYIHFLAIAYATVYLLYGREQVLLSAWGRPIMKCGQQSLPVFMFGMILARVAGMVLDVLGREIWIVILVNAGGFGMMIGFAYLLGWLKSEPWKKRPAAKADANPQPSRPVPAASPAAGD